jgi:peptide/nickel transport system permease protein
MFKQRVLLERAFRNKNVAITSVVLVTLLACCSIIPYTPLFHDTEEMHYDRILAPPGGEFWFGTDRFGRDVFSQIVVGILISTAVGAIVMFFSTLAGTIVGVAIGYFPKAEKLLMPIVDAMMSFPALLLALGLTAALGPTFTNLILALTFVYMPRTARIVRSATLSIKTQDYVQAARSFGSGAFRLIFRHIVPNCFAPLFVQATFVFAWGILAEASLGFIGIGVQPPTPTLGNILADGKIVLREAPWLTLFPASAIFVLVLSLNLMADGLRCALDPKTSETR